MLPNPKSEKTRPKNQKNPVIIPFIIFVFYMIRSHQHFSGGANFTKMPLKSYQFSKKSYWDFPSIFCFYFRTRFWSTTFSVFFVYDSDTTKEHFSGAANHRKILEKVRPDLGHPNVTPKMCGNLEYPGYRCWSHDIVPKSSPHLTE